MPRSIIIRLEEEILDTLEQLAVQDFFFQPDYDRPWHYLNVLAQQALGDTT
jgi:hypothetical protein